MNRRQTPPEVGEHCACGAYPGGGCDGWCYGNSMKTNWDIHLMQTQRDLAMTALSMLNSLLDFEEPLFPAEPQWFQSTDGINEAYAFAYAVIRGNPTPELKAMKSWHAGLKFSSKKSSYEKSELCEEQCQLAEHKGYQPCQGHCSYAIGDLGP